MTINRRQFALAGAVAFVVSDAFAQPAETKAVEAAIEEMNKAMLAADAAKLAALTSEQMSYGHSAGRIETKAQFMDIVAGKKTLYKSISLADASVAVVGNNAIARHIMSVDTEAGGKPASAKVGVMQVWVKDGDGWKLLARQAFRLAA
jgi:ketosteroid isomerase-like protein